MSVDVNQNHVQMSIFHTTQAEILHAEKDAAKPSSVAANFALFVVKRGSENCLDFDTGLIKKNMVDSNLYMRI